MLIRVIVLQNEPGSPRGSMALVSSVTAANYNCGLGIPPRVLSVDETHLLLDFDVDSGSPIMHARRKKNNGLLLDEYQRSDLCREVDREISIAFCHADGDGYDAQATAALLELAVCVTPCI